MSLALLFAPLAMLLATPQADPTVLLDQSFTLHANAEAAAEPMGLYAMHAEQLGNKITISESVELTTRKGTIDFSSIVIYKQHENGSWSFHAATAATAVEGSSIMAVSVAPNDDDDWLVTTTFHADDQGNQLANPQPEKRTLVIPKGTVLFSSARAVMGPRLQPKPGQQPVVWVEFPDDIDEDLNIKEGFSLVRDQPNDDTFNIWVKSDSQIFGPLPLTNQGNIKPHKLWGKMLMREKQ